jgi:hypothetical protein
VVHGLTEHSSAAGAKNWFGSGSAGQDWQAPWDCPVQLTRSESAAQFFAQGEQVPGELAPHWARYCFCGQDGVQV